MLIGTYNIRGWLQFTDVTFQLGSKHTESWQGIPLQSTKQISCIAIINIFETRMKL